MLTINGKTVEAEGFMYDGCHKIYLIDNADSKRRMIEDSGWSEDDIRPLSELPDVWADTCFLRFINSGDLKTSYVEQGEDATIIWSETVTGTARDTTDEVMQKLRDSLPGSFDADGRYFDAPEIEQ